MFKNLGNLAAIMKQAQQMQGRMRDIQENLGKLRVEGSAGGGMVRVEASGQQQLIAFHVEKSLLESGDQEMLEDLLLAATNQALEKAKDAAAAELSKLTGDFEIPGLGDALSKLGLGS
jgi:DNA-binding YbaB/EbfC family protein